MLEDYLELDVKGLVQKLHMSAEDFAKRFMTPVEELKAYDPMYFVIRGNMGITSEPTMKGVA